MSYSSEVLADSPYAYLRLDETSGGTATDSSGNGRNGTYVNGPTLGVAGLIPNDGDLAASFARASSQYVTVADDNGLDGLGAITIEAWVKPVTNVTSVQIAARDGATANRSFQFSLVSGKLTFIRIPGSVITATGSTTLVSGTVYHVAAVYNGTDIRLYVNGVLDNTPTACTGSLGTSTEDLRIGARRNSTPTTTDYWNGVLDDVAIYTSGLSAARIAAHYAAGTGSAASGTGAMSLSGAGAGGIGASATAALSLAGSGTAGSTDAGTASLAFSASGAAAAPDTGTGSLSLSGAGAAAGIQPATGTASLSLSGTGSTTASSPASGAAALSLDTSGTATTPAGAAASIDLTATATPAGTAPTGTAALSLNASGTAGSSQAGSGSGALSLNGTGLVLAPVSAAALLTLSAAEVAYASSQAFLELGVLTAEAFELYLTDLTNAFNGRRRRGRATAWVDRPAVTPGRAFGPRYDKAIAYDTPTMVDGRPT